MPIRLRCENCRKFKDDVIMREHPLAAEVYDDHTLVPLCEDCTDLICEEV